MVKYEEINLNFKNSKALCDRYVWYMYERNYGREKEELN